MWASKGFLYAYKLDLIRNFCEIKILYCNHLNFKDTEQGQMTNEWLNINRIAWQPTTILKLDDIQKT